MKLTLPYRMTLVLIMAISFSLPALAEETTVVKQTDFHLILGERTWISNGKSDFNIAGAGGVPNVLSELKWAHLHSTVVELSADAFWAKPRIIAKVDVGAGGIGGGQLTDSDYAGNNRTLLFSESVSSVDNNQLWYVNLDVGYRVWISDTEDMRGERRGFVDMFLGYQHWSEKYEASKFVQTQDPFGVIGGTGPFSNQGVGISETFKWDSLRLGGRGQVELLPKLSLRGKAIFIPYTHFTLEDIHHFRSDLAQNPSVKATTDGGWGTQLDIALAYNIWRAVSVEGGYQYWYAESGHGTANVFGSDGSTGQVILNKAHSTRNGVIVGLNVKF